MVERALADYDAAYGRKHAWLGYSIPAGADPDGEIGECGAVEPHLSPWRSMRSFTGPPLTVRGVDYPAMYGTAVRDDIYVANLAAWHVAPLEHLRAHRTPLTLTLGTGVGHSVPETLACTEPVAGRPLRARTVPRRSGDPAGSIADPTPSPEVLGLMLQNSWRPEHIVESAWCWRSQRRGAFAG
jgi:UDP-glucose 4-epimerase